MHDNNHPKSTKLQKTQWWLVCYTHFTFHLKITEKFGYLHSVKRKSYGLKSNKSKDTSNSTQYDMTYLYWVSCILVDKIRALKPRKSDVK